MDALAELAALFVESGSQALVTINDQLDRFSEGVRIEIGTNRTLESSITIEDSISTSLKGLKSRKKQVKFRDFFTQAMGSSKSISSTPGRLSGSGGKRHSKTPNHVVRQSRDDYPETAFSVRSRG